jgi:PAS domain S-box-containing protein
MKAADELMGWDSCAFDLYFPESDTTRYVLAMDLIEGQRVETAPEDQAVKPSPKFRQVINDGPQMVLRGTSAQPTPGFSAFGDKAHLSASLLFVPIRYQQRVTGILTVQKYAAYGYTEEDLNTLLALADHCGGAIERIQAEERVHRIEGLYRQAIGGAGAVPYVYDYRTKKYSFIGEGIEQMTGYKPEEISSELWTSIVKESEMAGEATGLEKMEAARRVQAGEIRNWRCDMRIVTRDGKSRWIADASVQNLDETGSPVGSMGILEDITDRKAVEQSLHRERSMLRTLVDVLPDSVYAKDIAGRKTLANPADVWNTGRQTEADVLGKTDFDLFPRETAQKFVGDDRAVLEFGQPVLNREESFRDAHGVEHWLLTSKMPLRDERGGVTGLIGIGRDITERRRADEALRKSETQFRLVWENSEDGMRLTNRDGIILRVNEAYCRMVQKPRRELEGRLLTVVQAAANADFVLGSYRKSVDTKSLEPRLETQVTLWNGREVWFELSNSLLEVPGQESLVLCIFRDITQRKRGAEELERLHKQLLEVSRQAGMAEVATSVLHNVGNVLNSVNVSSSLISDKVRNSKVTNLVKAIELLRANASNLAAFLSEDAKGRQLLDYLFGLAEHLSAEQTETLKELKSLAGNIDHIKEIVAMQQNYAKVLGVLESLPVADLVEDALRLNSGAMERHHVTVLREYSEVPPILVDKHKVLQILVNLIRNAKYALDDRGHSEKLLTLRIASNGNNTVKIAVIDNGIGIPAEHLTRIFEHGFTTRKEGHGFGLHNGALAAKDLGGSLAAQSDGPGKGAVFTLELPLQPKEKGHDTRLQAKAAAAKSDKPAAKSAVLAVG